MKNNQENNQILSNKSKRNQNKPLLRQNKLSQKVVYYVIGIILISFGLFLFVYADIIRFPSKSEIAKRPRLIFEETSYNFGTIDQEKVSKYTFKFTNTGNENLEIREILTS